MAPNERRPLQAPPPATSECRRHLAASFFFWPSSLRPAEITTVLRVLAVAVYSRLMSRGANHLPLQRWIILRRHSKPIYHRSCCIVAARGEAPTLEDTRVLFIVIAAVRAPINLLCVKHTDVEMLRRREQGRNAFVSGLKLQKVAL